MLCLAVASAMSKRPARKKSSPSEVGFDVPTPLQDATSHKDLDAAAASQNDLDADEAAAIDMGLHSE